MSVVPCASLLPFDNFESPALPSDLPTYARYRLDSLELFQARRLRILNAITYSAGAG